MKSVRKVLAQSLACVSKDAEVLTGKSINSLPEFFLAVKVAEYVNTHFSTFTFSMEDSLSKLCDSVGIDCENIDREFRIEKNTRADLVLKDRKSHNVKHIVEFKRGLDPKQIKKDALRLAWICANAPIMHRIEKNYLVAISHRSPDLFDKRTAQIQEWVSKVSPSIVVRFEPVDLSEFKSTQPNAAGRVLFGGVWEFRYKY